MKIMFLTMALGLIAAAQTPAPAKVDPPAPLVSIDHQKSYWKELSAYRGAEAEDQKAMRTATAAEQFMASQKTKVEQATAAIQSDCGEKFTLDSAQVQKGEFVCIAKPVAPATPTPAPVPAVKP